MNLQRLLSDEIIELIASITNESLESDDVVKFVVTEEMISFINDSIRYKNKNPQIRSMEFFLEKDIKIRFISSADADEEKSSEIYDLLYNKYKKILLDTYENVSWVDHSEEKDKRKMSFEVSFSEFDDGVRNLGATISYRGSYISIPIDLSMEEDQYKNTLRKLLTKDVELLKWE